MLNKVYCIDVKSIDKNITMHHDLSCNVTDHNYYSKRISENDMSSICEEEFTKGNKLCYDDCQYEICSVNNIDHNIENDSIENGNIKEVKIKYEYNDEITDYDINKQLINDIKEYASKLNREDFYETGTINDYSQLFESISNMANEYKQLDLNFEIDGFNEFSNTAEQLIDIFESFSRKLQNINIINDTTFLISISIALEKMCKLTESFINFKKTILSLPDIKLPKTICDTTVLLSNVMVDVTCAVNYISHFINPNDTQPLNSEIKLEEKIAIQNAINIINDMNTNMECYDIKSKLERDEIFKSIIRYNNSIKKSSNILKNATTILKNKIKNYKFN